MFRECVSKTVFTGEAADRIFQNITGDSYNDDVSFLATLRAIIAPNMKEGESLHFYVRTLHADTFVQELSTSDALRQLDEFPIYDENCLSVVNISGVKANTSHMMNLIADGIGEPYVKEQVFTKWCNDSDIIASVYTAAEKRSTIILVCQMDLVRFHLLQTGIVRCLPWYFDGGHITKESDAGKILLAIGDKDKDGTPATYLSILNEIAKRYDFRSELIKAKLSGFEAKYYQRMAERSQNSIDEWNRKIENLYRQAAEYVDKIRSTQATLFGSLELANEKNSNELMNYFLANQHLILQHVEGETIKFVCYGYYMDMWDEDACERAIANTESALYRNRHGASIDDCKKLWQAIFIDQTLKLRMCGAYNISANHSSHPIEHFDYPSECSGWMPNPHGDGFGCIGSHGQYINEAMTTGNYVAAVEQCCAAARNLNFTDATVMGYFVDQLLRDESGKWVEAADGTCMTGKEAIKYLTMEDVK